MQLYIVCLLWALFVVVVGVFVVVIVVVVVCVWFWGRVDLCGKSTIICINF